EQLPVLVEVFMREINPIQRAHLLDMLRRSRIDGEVGRASLLELIHDVEGERQLPLRTPGVAALDFEHEGPDWRDRRPAWHAVIRDVKHAVRLQTLAND